MLLAAAPSAHAASCNSASHNITLTNGRVMPGSGTTATSFTFSVVYQDSRDCAPSEATVHVPLVGAYPLTGTGTNYRAGVTFQRTVKLPAGSHAYNFTFTSGSGNGTKSATLTVVSPAKVVVTLPATPVPTPVPPKPTPKPTPKPIPIPQPIPTPIPPATAVPTPVPTAVPTLDPTAVTSPSFSESQEPATGSGSATSEPTLAGEGLATGSDGPGEFGLPLARGAAWLAATVGGLAFFLVLMRRRDEPAVADLSAPVAEGPRHPLVQHAVAPETPPDEVNLPRWLRPSVQAARGRRR